MTSKSGKQKRSPDSKIRKNNDKVINSFHEMMSTIPNGSQQSKGEDFDIYKMPLFKMCIKVIQESEKLSFEEATSMIGHSLRADFSELETYES